MRPKPWQSDAMSTNTSTSNSKASRGFRSAELAAGPAPGARLALVAAAITSVWLLVLPRVATFPPIQAHIDRNEAAGIDPAAKFYSELPAMPRLLELVREDFFSQPDRHAVREAARKRSD